MAQCKDCIHNGLCKIYSDFIRNHDCELFVGKADVVPKRKCVEYEYKFCHIVGNAKVYTKTLEDYYKTRKSIEQDGRAEIAREIFEEIEKHKQIIVEGVKPVYTLKQRELEELKKKYTEGEK